MTKFKGKIIYSLDNAPHNITIFDSFRKRWMTFGNEYIQSAIYKRKPWQPLLSYITPLSLGLYAVRDPGKILLLGMGGGALVHYLLHYFPQCHITAIEINARVIDLAQKYFQISASDRLDIIHAAAEEVILSTSDTYDVIIVDLFQPQHYPISCASLDFFRHCNLLLNEPGALSLNTVYEGEPEFSNILKNLGDGVSKQTLCLPIEKTSNILIHSFKGINFVNLLQEFEQQQLLSRVRWDSKFGIIGAV